MMDFDRNGIQCKLTTLFKSRDAERRVPMFISFLRISAYFYSKPSFPVKEK